MRIVQTQAWQEGLIDGNDVDETTTGTPEEIFKLVNDLKQRKTASRQANGRSNATATNINASTQQSVVYAMHNQGYNSNHSLPKDQTPSAQRRSASYHKNGHPEASSHIQTTQVQLAFQATSENWSNFNYDAAIFHPSNGTSGSFVGVPNYSGDAYQQPTLSPSGQNFIPNPGAPDNTIVAPYATLGGYSQSPAQPLPITPFNQSSPESSDDQIAGAQIPQFPDGAQPQSSQQGTPRRLYADGCPGPSHYPRGAPGIWEEAVHYSKESDCCIPDDLDPSKCKHPKCKNLVIDHAKMIYVIRGIEARLEQQHAEREAQISDGHYNKFHNTLVLTDENERVERRAQELAQQRLYAAHMNACEWRSLYENKFEQCSELLEFRNMIGATARQFELPRSTSVQEDLQNLHEALKKALRECAKKDEEIKNLKDDNAHGSEWSFFSWKEKDLSRRSEELDHRKKNFWSERQQRASLLAQINVDLQRELAVKEKSIEELMSKLNGNGYSHIRGDFSSGALTPPCHIPESSFDQKTSLTNDSTPLLQEFSTLESHDPIGPPPRGLRSASMECNPGSSTDKPNGDQADRPRIRLPADSSVPAQATSASLEEFKEPCKTIRILRRNMASPR